MVVFQFTTNYSSISFVINKIANLLVSSVGSSCFMLNLFSHCFDLKDFNLTKHFERFRKVFLFTRQLI